MTSDPILPDDEPPSMPSMPTHRAGAATAIGRIDHYELLRKLGGGGFGVVYLAQDVASGLDVAIKTLHPLLKHNAEEMDMLREKFALVSRLSHPNIATALVLHPCREVDIWDEGARRDLKISPGDSVMVMRYAPGVTLSRWRRQFPDGVVPFDLVLEIGRQVAASLDYAHSERIVHRDVKPGNIMVETQENGRVRARILDFGLAAEIRSSMSRVSTEQGDTSGTRPYMAPEQWLGRKQDGRTDQYALACVLYEMLSGAPPFAGVFETGDPTVMKSAVVSDPPEEIAGLAPATNAALLRALSKNASDRFPSCMDFVLALEPSVLDVSATLDGRKVEGAELSIGGQTVPLPAELELEFGDTIGPGDVLYFDASGRRHGGRLSETCVDWHGLKPLEIPLSAIRDSPAASPPPLRASASMPCGTKAGERRMFRLSESVSMPFRWCPATTSEEWKSLWGGKAKALSSGKDDVFLMGSPVTESGRRADEFRHEVRLTKGFWISETPVLQIQWMGIMGSNPSFSKGAEKPVDRVRWKEAVQFVESIREWSGLPVSLPSEAQWEYACRAGSEFAQSGGSVVIPVSLMILFCVPIVGPILCSAIWTKRVQPVQTKSPNGWGLYDMLGNCGEWCSDWYGPYPATRVEDPYGPPSGRFRIVRGMFKSRFKSRCRCATRWCLSPTSLFRPRLVGLRLVLNP